LPVGASALAAIAAIAIAMRVGRRRLQ